MALLVYARPDSAVQTPLVVSSAPRPAMADTLRRDVVVDRAPMGSGAARKPSTHFEVAEAADDSRPQDSCAPPSSTSCSDRVRSVGPGLLKRRRRSLQ